MRLLLPMAMTVLLATMLAACSGSSASTTTAPTQTFATDVVTGTVAAPVNGALQSDFKTFVVGQGGGVITVSLTSAIETLPGGAVLNNIAMSLSVGQPSGTTCTPLASATTVGIPGTAVLQGTVAAGTYCALVADATGQLGPVAYALSIVHP